MYQRVILFQVKPPAFPLASGQAAVGQAAFNAVAAIVNKITTTTDVDVKNDRLKRNELLTTYVHFQAHLPHPSDHGPPKARQGFSSADHEVSDIIAGDVTGKDYR